MDNAVEIAKKTNEIILNVGRKYAQEFEKDNIKFTEVLLNLGGCRKMMVWLYCILRNTGKVPAIENLPKEEKEHIWEFMKEICTGEHRRMEKMKQMAMAFYALEYFLNEQK